MSEVLIPAAEAGVNPDKLSFDPRAAALSVGVSILINGVMPFVLYKLLVPYFPAGSIMPFVYASAFPLVGLAAGYVRTRMVDFIALIALFGIAYSVVTALLAGQVRSAMILGATQAFSIAAGFLVSALIGRPVIFFIARQFAAGNSKERRAQFEAVNAADGVRTFFIATMVWVVGIAGLGVASMTLAVLFPPASYLLFNNIINTAVNVLLVVWTIRFTRTRLMKVGERLAGKA
jgi:hypothetical protein